jgi:hypothetical protein
MKDTTDLILANDGPGALLDLNGKEFWADYIGDYHRDEFCKWIKKRHKEDVYTELLQFGNDIAATALRQVAAKISAGDFDWLGKEWHAEINSIQGRIKFMFILVKRRQPKLDEIEFRNAVMANELVNLRKIADLLNELLGNAKTQTEK